MKKENIDLIDLSNHHPVMLYDGDCILCSGAVMWIIEHDKQRKIKYCPLQSEHAHNVSGIDHNDKQEIDTVYLIHHGKIYGRSDVTFKILSIIGWPWKALTIFKIIPKRIRDAIYNLIARNRYRWFGYQKRCMIPDASIRKLFIAY